MFEYGGAIVVEVFAKLDHVLGLAEQLRQLALTIQQRQIP